MRRMKIVLLLAVPLCWIVYWVGTAQIAERYVGPWLEARPIGDAQLAHGGLSMAGFPHRFDLSVTRPQLFDISGYGWSAPSMRMEAASYWPQDVTLRLPGTQQLHLPDDTVTVTSARLDGGARLRPLNRLGLDALRLDAEQLHLESRRGWTAGIGAGTVRMRRADGSGRHHDLTAEAQDIIVPAALAGRAVPARIDHAALDARLEFARPLDMDAADGVPPVVGLELHEGRLAWGRVELRAAGALDVDAEGLPDGQITLGITHWRDLLDLVEAAELLTGTQLALAERALQSLEDRSGSENTVEAPLTLADGMIRLGPVPLAPIPRL